MSLNTKGLESSSLQTNSGFRINATIMLADDLILTAVLICVQCCVIVYKSEYVKKLINRINDTHRQPDVSKILAGNRGDGKE